MPQGQTQQSSEKYQKGSSVPFFSYEFKIVQ